MLKLLMTGLLSSERAVQSAYDDTDGRTAVRRAPCTCLAPEFSYTTLQYKHVNLC